MPLKFALITEGISEYRIISHIIYKFFKGLDVLINQVQPKVLNEKQETPGGWSEVLKYCGREEIREIMLNNDYLVVQVDTDQSATSPFDISHSDENHVRKTIERLHQEVKAKLLSLFHQDIIEQFGDRIIFAISVHTIECWLLPLKLTHQHASDINNCLHKLNHALTRKGEKTIPNKDKNSVKAVRIYESILRDWKRRSDIESSAGYNFGFSAFVKDLAAIDESTKPQPEQDGTDV